MNIKTFGPVDDRSLKQLETCMRAGDAEFGVLCADHHPGYSQPIGGAVAYEGYISPSGVGYDIACVARGSPVATASGLAMPVEDVSDDDEPLCWDTTTVRPAAPSFGAVSKGRREVVRLVMANGRDLVVTHDHPMRVKTGWKPAGGLKSGEKLACLPFIGIEPKETTGLLEIEHAGRWEKDLGARGLWPVTLDSPRTPSLIKLLAYCCGDGHLTPDGKRTSLWTTIPADAAMLQRELQTLGFEAGIYRRPRSGRKDEIQVYVGSCALHALFAAMGAPVGKKVWPAMPMPWLFKAPDWVRALFLSSFASAEATTPRLVDGRICNLAIKQAGENPNAAAFIARIFESLGFEVSGPAPSGPPLGRRQTYLVQLLGGEDAQLRFFERIGFCLASEKRVAAAAVASVAWQRAAERGRRQAVWAEARAARAAGARWDVEIERIATARGLSRSFVYHAWYDRGEPRTAKGARYGPDHSAEVAWVPVASVEPCGSAQVYDVVTADSAESFIANGLVVHNCGNKAVQTDIARADLDAAGGVEPVMREIARRISFGMGVPAQERVEHPVLERIAGAPFEPQRKLHDLAAEQLGTVGSGNHFVNLFEDEQGTIWVGVHFGSRGFGHKTASGFLALAQGKQFSERAGGGEMDSPPILFDAGSDLGQAYIEAMTLAGDYAYAGRDVVVDKVLEILGAGSVHEVHNHHNFAWREEHFGRELWVIRKGCTPARPGQEGFVGATMGDESVILEGAADAEADEALHSTVHGAGRVMSRRQAAGRIRRRKGRVEQISPGKVDWPAVKRRLEGEGIVLIGGAADEAPEVYKRLPEVLAAHGDTIRVKQRLKPIGVAMAGREVFDPYKD